MSNKQITQILLSGVLLIFILYFVFLHFFVFHVSRYSNTLDSITSSAQVEDWDTAVTSLNRFKTYWDSAHYYIEFNNADQNYYSMDSDIAALEASVHNKQKYETDLYVKKVKSLIEDFKEITPEP